MELKPVVCSPLPSLLVSCVGQDSIIEMDCTARARSRPVISCWVAQGLDIVYYIEYV